MITFKKQVNQLLLRYEPENSDPDWLAKRLESDDEIALSNRCFFLRSELYRPHLPDLDFEMDAVYHFVIGEKLAGGYFQIDKRVVDINYNLFLHEGLKFKRETFVAETNIAIFRGFKDYGLNELYIGGEHPDAVPQEVFEELLSQFPTTTELKKYARARVSGMIRAYVPIERDFEAEYTKYRGRRRSVKGTQPRKVFAPYETDKFSALVEKLEGMLEAPEGDYSEKQWQEEILQVILLLFPKYIAAFPEAPLRDNIGLKDRRIDFLLLDAAGFVDAIEIKKPLSGRLVTPNQYRYNHVPMRELTGTIMQLEKYLFHLNRWSDAGEAKLNSRYADKLPDGLTIKIVNPSGMIIFGRDHELTPTQKADFEVIRRKFRHIFEIMTYDDLLRRLKVIHAQFMRGSTVSDCSIQKK